MIKMKPVTYCDKCENEIDSAVSFDDMDFCQNCYADLKGLINGWLHPIAPAEEEPIEIEIPEFMEKKMEEPKTLSEIKATPNKNGSQKKVKISTCGRKPIDWDKACALKIAGRSNAWIADEMGCKKSTIDVNIYKHLEEYKRRKAWEEAEAKRKVLEA